MKPAKPWEPTPEQVEDTQYCCLHVVTGDMNLGDEHVREALERARQAKCAFCLPVAEWLAGLTHLERAQWMDRQGMMCDCCRESNGLRPRKDAE